MHSTKEVRWFFTKPLNTDETLLSSSGLSFHQCASRNDIYLRYDNKNLGIKLREGKLEIKEMKGRSKLVALSPDVKGYAQSYVKWSFSLRADEEAGSVKHGQRENWLSVHKRITGFKLSQQKDGTLVVVEIPEQVKSGCQVDYTQLTIEKHRWFTLGLEWFGEQHITLEPDWIQRIFGSAELSPDMSMGYPEFLRNYF